MTRVMSTRKSNFNAAGADLGHENSWWLFTRQGTRDQRSGKKRHLDTGGTGMRHEAWAVNDKTEERKEE